MLALLQNLYQTLSMEASGEFIPPSPEERIRQAAMGHLLDAKSGFWGGGRENLTSRSVTYMLEANDPHDEDVLSIVHVISLDESLNVAVTQFREDLAANRPIDAYAVTGFTAMVFPDPFSSEVVEGNTAPPFDLNAVAEVLEDQDIEELNRTILIRERTLDEALALSTAGLISHRLWTDWIVGKYSTDAYLANAADRSKVREVISGLRRILKF